MSRMSNPLNFSVSRRAVVACPFFMPTEKLENGEWLHSSRLPLGSGWSGKCAAPGHEGEVPSQEELREFCNLGYAERCGRLPRERVWDSVRFAARTVGNEGMSGSSGRIQVRYVCERGHCPVEHGVLEFDSVSGQWNSPHRDDRVQRMAECFLQSYVERRRSQEVERVAS
ncbi:MAG: hypothetical protein QOF56_3830 [Acidobacteriaceae bacterium]|jgi:hypothetical protein|nr:hypothetical protein [Acidobacteriaceae bacterium]